MIPRINSIKPLPDYKLAVAFDDGKRVTYDVKEDMNLPGYGLLRGGQWPVPAGSVRPEPHLRILER